MKISLILISFIAILIIAQVYISKSTDNTEQHNYQILKKYDKFEVRKYEPALFSSVKLGKKGYKESSGEGFRILAGYIFGNNKTNEKIAMTSPVKMELGDTTKMSFMVPKSYNLESLPNPNSDKIEFEKQDEKIIAAIQFDGWADNDKIEFYKSILKEELTKANLLHNNKFSFLGYNPPYEVVNRRNEVTVELINYK
jgi:hypothetical protein